MGRISMVVAATASISIVLLAYGGTAIADSGGCHPVSGSFVATSPTDCPGIFCTVGQLSGALDDATYSFVGYAIAPDGGLLGHSTITLEDGAVISSNDESVLSGPPAPGTTFVTTVNFASGTREFAQVTGGLTAPGIITDNGTVGTYSGEYCLAGND